MDRVNSLRLGKYDVYGRRFDTPGTYGYCITTLGAEPGCGTASADFELIVEGPDESRRGRKGQQHNVQVLYDAGSRRYRVEPDRLIISTGDVVLWHKPDQAGVEYAIIGKGEKEAFDSRRLDRYTVYMHTFRQPGTYHYENTLGEGRGQSGVVNVAPAGKDRDAWCERVTKPPVITYAKGRFSPQKVEAVQLGTVVWSIEDDAGISVVVEPTRRPGKTVTLTTRPRPRAVRRKE